MLYEDYKRLRVYDELNYSPRLNIF